jgi:hypothetical protein
MRLPALPPPPRVEIVEVPGAWLMVDLGGLLELNSTNTNDALKQFTRQALVKALHAHRTVIKLAFRYYALAGVANVDDDPNT